MKIYSLGWSDIAIFAIFENEHYAANQVYFYESNPIQKIGEIGPHVLDVCISGKVFTLKKSQGP